MLLFLLALGLLVGGALGALVAQRSARWATALGVGGAVTGCVAGLIPASRILLGEPSQSLRMTWQVPYGAFFVQIDALSAFFLLPMFGLSALAAVYGAEYMVAHRGERSPAASWFFFDLLVASMAMVVVARNAVLFLVAWEMMALASFFLVTYEDDEESVREAGWTYLVATHLGTAWLLVLFILLGRGTGSLDFDHFGAASGGGLLFILAVVGFGTKAGFMPFHVWLPEAHPAAPSHVSAVMSGVMIKTGIYGLLRTLTFLGPLPWWAGWLLVAVGVTSGVFGVLLALAQPDLKRLLAYSSVENIGIVLLGLGLGLVGMHTGSPALAVLGFGGGLLHVVNHAVFKGLLFLGAGAVLHSARTRTMEELGGLLRRMPWTGIAFLTGAVAVAGLPPLNGFASEFLIYLGAFEGATSLGNAGAVPALVVIVGLAMIGGLAAACFTKAFGVAFLGEPRSEHAAHAREVGPAMRLPMQLLAASCVVIGVASPALVGALAPVLRLVSDANVNVTVRYAPNGSVVLEEEDSITIHAPESSDAYMIDFDILLRAKEQDVTFGKFFVGGLAVRIPWDKANQRQTHLNSNGLRDRACEQQRAAWCNVERPFGNEIFGIAVFDYPANPNHPPGWRADEQGVINANVSALGDWSIHAKQERVFRYRLLVYRGAATREQLATRFATFAGDARSDEDAKP